MRRLQGRGGETVKKKRIWIIPLAVAVLLFALFLGYTGQYYRADETAERALNSDVAVTVERTDYGWFFDGPSETDALVFYPGAKVEETAYAPLLHRLAERGMDVCLVRMPFRLAVFGQNRGLDVMKLYQYDCWYIGGHSLGGAMASGYASKHGDQLNGVILLGAYAMDELDEDLTTVLIYGSEDNVLNMENYEKSRSYLPNSAVEHIIPGGNHAQFGSYGKQKGDGEASISPEEQIEETISVILAAVDPTENP